MTEERPESLTERELSAMLHRSVAGLEPDPGSLARLRTEIPRRRAQRRQVVTGAAVVLAVLTVVPALHAAEVLDLSTGPTASRTDANAAPGGGSAPGRGIGWPTASSRLPGTGDPWSGAPTAAASVIPGPSVTPTPGPPNTPPQPCDHLVVTDSHVDPADANGKQYGWFLARNTAGQTCRLADPGALTVSAATGVDPATVQVVTHTASDAATALPAPTVPAQVLVVPAGALYRVRFGLVPNRSCQAPAPSADPGPSAAGAAPGSSAKPAAAGATSAPNDGGSPSATATPSSGPSPSGSPTGADSSITLAYAPPQAGSPTTLVLRGACGGTVYRAAPEAASGSPSAGPS